MSTHTQRIEVFQDTMAWIGADSDLAASVDAAKKSTQVFYEDDYPAFDAAETGKMVVAVSGDAELFGCHVKRAIHMLTCAADKGADMLVLGAFGCGAFQNNPEVVARAFKTALQEFPKVFRRVEFAVYCPPGGSRNYEVFKRVLG